MDYTKTLDVIAKTTDRDKIRQIITNTQKLYGPDHPVVQAGHARLQELLGTEGVIAVEYEAMRKATIEVTRKDPRLTTLRDNRGAIGAIEELMKKPPSKAFDKLVAAGRADETCEAIVLRHPDDFTAAAVAEAQKRLEV
jgi:hypothetical protein